MRLFAIVVSSIGASALSCWVIAQIAKCISQWWAWRTIEQAARKTPIPPAPRVPSIRVRDYSIPVERVVEVANKYPQWRRLAENWPRLLELYNEEASGPNAPKLYKAIQTCTCRLPSPGGSK